MLQLMKHEKFTSSHRNLKLQIEIREVMVTLELNQNEMNVLHSTTGEIIASNISCRLESTARSRDA